VSGALTFLLLVAPWGSPDAGAHPGSNCIDTDEHVQATNETQVGNHQGVKSLVLFGIGDNDCVRVSSLNVVNSNGWVEWGWNLGWTFGGVCGEDDQYWVNPERFVTWKPINGSFHCRLEDWVTNGHWTLTLRDQNSDTEWGYTFEGTQLDTMNVNFDRGKILTNSERSSSSDRGRAHFENLKFQIAGTTTWYDFVALDQVADDMLDNWNCIRVSDTNQKVEQDTRTCSLE